MEGDKLLIMGVENVDPIIETILDKLSSQDRDPLLPYRTETRGEYEILLDAAREGKYPDLLSITHKGLRFKKRHVHAPPRSIGATV